MGERDRICFSCGRTIDDATGVEVGGRHYCAACSVSRLLDEAKAAEEPPRPETGGRPRRISPLLVVLLTVAGALALAQAALLSVGFYRTPPSGPPPREAAQLSAPATRATDGALAALWQISRAVRSHHRATGRFPDRLDQIREALPADPLGSGYDYRPSPDGRGFILAIRNASAYGVRSIACDAMGIPRVEP